MIGAALHLVHQIVLKIQSEILSLPFADGDLPRLPLLIQDGQLDLGIVAVKLIVENIADRMSVNRLQALAGADARPVRRALPVDRYNFRCHGTRSFPNGVNEKNAVKNKKIEKAVNCSPPSLPFRLVSDYSETLTTSRPL